MKRIWKFATAILLAFIMIVGISSGAAVYGAGLSPIAALERTITYEDTDCGGEISFVIPIIGDTPGTWNIHIAGRAEYADGFSRSLHYLDAENEAKAWKVGQTYIVPVDPACKELTMEAAFTAADGTVSAGSIDLRALTPLALADKYKAPSVAAFTATDGTRIDKADNWYTLPRKVLLTVRYDGLPDTISVYLTPTGTEMSAYRERIAAVVPQQTGGTVQLELNFSQGQLAHLDVVAEYDGLSLYSDLYNIYYEHTYSTWAQDYINDADRYGILPSSLQTCDYKAGITREEFCELAYETIGAMQGSIAYSGALNESNASGETDFFERYGFGAKPIYPSAPEGKAPFSDTDNAHIAALYALGIVEGKGGGFFAPTDSLTREEAAAIVGRMAAYFHLQRFDDGLTFSDAQVISAWAQDDVARVCGMGLMVGMGDGTFSPRTDYTREQAIAVAVRLMASIPTAKEEIAAGRYFVSNSMYLWVEDADGKILLKLPYHWDAYQYRPDYGYIGLRFFTHDGKLIATGSGSDTPAEAEDYTSFFDVESGQKLFSLENATADAGSFFGLTVGGKYIITERFVPGAEFGRWETCYGVYTFEGKALMATKYDWDALRSAGYVNTQDSVGYVWE